MAAVGRVLVVEHEPNGGPAVVGRILEQRGWELTRHLVTPDPERPWEFQPFPDWTPYDVCVVMGSYRSVNDVETIGAWIDAEIALVAAAHHGGCPVLGICFGGQVLAAALGGSVERAPETEVGWYRISGADNPVGPGPWFQWHHDRFIVPPGGEVLARTAVGPQLFRLGASVGTQFHPEVDRAHLATWLDGAEPEYLAEVGVDPEALLSETAEREAAAAVRCDSLVDWFLGGR